MDKTQITLINPLDMHIHFRDNDMLSLVAPLTSKHFSGALIMPNLISPIKDIKSLLAYKKRIQNSISIKDNFTPYMTLFFDTYSYEFLKQAKPHIKAIKLYPAGITTNSDGGVKNIDINSLKPTLQAMSDLNIILCIHGESNGFVMEREAEFLPTYELICKNFPKLKVIMEHITTKKACELLPKYDNLYASVTLHHLIYTLDDLAGNMLKPHLFCKPILKTNKDRDALLNLALSGNDKIIFGSDSAPHPTHTKECCGCAAGVFSAPICLSVLCEIFDKNNKLNNLQKFISDNGAKIYDINFKAKNIKTKSITLKKIPFKVVKIYEIKSKNIKVTPMKQNESLAWSVC
jgi:dihydroorotase